MTKKFKILSKFIKDMSSETANVETYLYVKERISKYKLGINIDSKPLKNQLVEVNTILKFEDQEENKKKSYFEMNYCSIVKVNEEIKDKKELEKIILSDVQVEISNDLEKSFLNLMHNSGYTEIKFEKKIDFEALYKKKFN